MGRVSVCNTGPHHRVHPLSESSPFLWHHSFASIRPRRSDWKRTTQHFLARFVRLGRTPRAFEQRLCRCVPGTALIQPTKRELPRACPAPPSPNRIGRMREINLTVVNCPCHCPCHGRVSLSASKGRRHHAAGLDGKRGMQCKQRGELARIQSSSGPCLPLLRRSAAASRTLREAPCRAISLRASSRVIPCLNARKSGV